MPEWAVDEDFETGFLLDAEDLSEDEARAEVLAAARRDGFILPTNVPIELRPFREPREDDWGYGDASLWPCAEGEEPVAMVWVADDIGQYSETVWHGPEPAQENHGATGPTTPEEGR